MRDKLMQASNQKMACSWRSLRRYFALAFVASLLPCSLTKADTVLQFGQEFPGDTVTATDSGGVTTLSTAGNSDSGGLSILVDVTNFLGMTVLFPAFETFVNVHSIGPASTFHGSIFQNYSGTIEFTSLPGGGGANYLTATFAPVGSSSAVGVSGLGGGSAASLQATQPPDILVLTSDFAKFGLPTSLAIGFSNVSPTLSIAHDGSIASFTAQNAGTLSAQIGVAPEPSNFLVAGIGALGMIGYGLWRRKALGA
jgi:hypothetical protein